MTSTDQTKATDSSTLYFAFGSNLSTTQMAARCPSSRLVGVGQLVEYTWVINSRGYANVVPCSWLSSSPPKTEQNVVQQRPSPSLLSYQDAPLSAASQSPSSPSQNVWGLLYSLPSPDESRLDRAEGVPGCYGKEWLSVRYWPLDASETKSTAAALFSDVRDPFMPTGADNEGSIKDHVAEEARRAQVADAPRSADVANQSIVPSGKADVSSQSHEVLALVYVDRYRVTKGTIKEEYVMRMRRACAESQERGVPSDWLDEVIRPWLG